MDVSAKNAPGTLGICDIENPIYNSNGSTYNRVYFGCVPSENTGKLKIDNTTIVDGAYDTAALGKEIYWRVLNTTANDDAKTPALFMLTEYCISKGMYWDNNSLPNGNQLWAKTPDPNDDYATTDSAIKILLQGTNSNNKYNGDVYYKSDNDKTSLSIYNDCFDVYEQTTILNTTKTEKGDLDWCVGYVAKACSLSKDKLFLLSAKEVVNQNYGFANNKISSNSGWMPLYPNDVNRNTKLLSNSDAKSWWLRSAFSASNFSLALLDSSGASVSAGSDYYNTHSVRFALNIPLSSILLATDCDLSSPSTSCTFSLIPSSLPRNIILHDSTLADTAGSKLTIVDDVSDRRNFWVPQVKYLIPKGSTESGTTITLPYRRAKTGEGEYISAIIKDKKDSHRYYARLKSLPNLGDSNGTVTMIIPGDIPFGDYTLIIMNEKENGYRRTNYAKNANLRLYIDGEKILITGNDAIGACTIRNPEYKEDGSIYDRVYFGKTPTLEDDTNTIQLCNKSYSSTAGGQVYVLHEQPIYWRVLNTTANDISGTPALFMLTEYCITNKMSWDNTPNYGNHWTKLESDSGDNNSTTDSAIKIFLNGELGGTYNSNYNGSNTGVVYTDPQSQHSAYKDCFDEKEQNVIMSTYNREDFESDKIMLHSSPHYAYGCGLTGEKLFLLSAKEVVNKEYGFNPNENASGWIYSNDINRRTCYYNSNGSRSEWWLRSAYSYNNDVAFVNTSGVCGNYDSSYTEICVRCALNIPLSQVLFASDASSAGTNLAPSDPVPSFLPITNVSSLNRTKITEYGSGGITILSTTTTNPTPTSTSVVPYFVSVSGTTVTTTPSATATVHYGAGAKLTIVDDNRSSFAVKEDIITASNGAYAIINYSGANIGTNEYISAIIKDTSGNPLYHARLKAVGTTQRDSIGTLTMFLPIDIDYGDYTLVIYNELERGAYKTNYAGYDTLMLTVAADTTSPTITNVYRNELGNKFKLSTSDENLSHMSTLEGQKIMDLYGINATENFQLCDNTSGIRVYDIAGNTTTVYANNIPIDHDPPSVTVSYAGGTYTLTVSDSESGVWKITNSSGDTIYRNYSSSATT